MFHKIWPNLANINLVNIVYLNLIFHEVYSKIALNGQACLICLCNMHKEG